MLRPAPERLSRASFSATFAKQAACRKYRSPKILVTTGLGPDGTFYFVVMKGYWDGSRPYTALKRVTRTGVVQEVYRLDGGFMQGAAPRVSPDGRFVALAIDVDSSKWDDFDSMVVIDTTSGSSKG